MEIVNLFHGSCGPYENTLVRIRLLCYNYVNLAQLSPESQRKGEDES